MKQAQVEEIQTSVGYPIIVFGDTTGFTRFLLRTIDNHNVSADYLRELYTEFCRFQAETDCYLKLECDGFISIHATTGHRDEKAAVQVLEACEGLASRVSEIIKVVPYPRPGGFRIRIAGGRPSMDMRIFLKTSPTCEIRNCVARETHDTIGYSGVLADRMLRIYKTVPLMCCGAIYEMVAHAMPHFEFVNVPPDKRIPDGVFPEDIQNLWAFKRRDI
jgi:hypothetical protein